MGRQFIRLLTAVYGVVCLGIVVLFVLNELELMHRPMHVAGRYAVRANRTWPAAISLSIYQDNSVPNVAPPFPPGRYDYTPAVLVWWHRTIPADIYRGAAGFACNTHPYLEINRGRSWVLLGKQFEARLPWWAAVIFFLPLTTPLVKRHLRRRLIQAGRCPNCGYDLRATPERCPECGRFGPDDGGGRIIS